MCYVQTYYKYQLQLQHMVHRPTLVCPDHMSDVRCQMSVCGTHIMRLGNNAKVRDRIGKGTFALHRGNMHYHENGAHIRILFVCPMCIVFDSTPSLSIP